MTDLLRVHAHLVDSLGSAARHGGSALADAPELLRRVLQEEAWREFVTDLGDHVSYRRFSDFVRTPPLKGLGVDMDLIRRVVGTGDVELLELLRAAEKVGRGSAGPGRVSVESTLTDVGSTTSYVAERLARDHADVHARVQAGELSVNAAAVLAGIRPRRVSVRLDSPESIVSTLQTANPELLRAVRDEISRRLDDDPDP